MPAKKRWIFVMFTVAFLSIALVAQQSGLVNVNISNVRTEIAKNVNVNVSQVPVTVQVPVDVAANVCGVSVSALTSQVQQGNATCTAQSTSSALNQIVQSQLNQQQQQQPR